MYKKFRLFGFNTSSIEVKDITRAWIMVSIAFGIVLGGINLGFFRMFLISLFAVGFGFLVHEMCHKITAQRFGYQAEFRAFNEMLFLAVIMSFLGFVFAAPGAVMIEGLVKKKDYGKIALAGPLSNLIMSIFFLVILYLILGFGGLKGILDLGVREALQLPLVIALLLVGFIINSWLALFNLIPVWEFDGAKIFRWNKKIYWLVVITAFILVFVV